MEISKLQKWVKDNFDAQLSKHTLDYGVARLFTQSGQLEEAVLNRGEVAKELCDVLFVLAALANRAGVDLGKALDQHLTGKDPRTFFSRLDKR